MEHRLGRTLRVFLVILASAGFYRLAVVPLVEPRVRDATAGVEMTPEEAAAIRARADRRLAALGDIFPAGAWERDEPIVLESRQMRLLFKEYQSLPDGRVNLVPCTLVVLPDRSRSPDGSGGRTIVMRAPQGAVLEFDEPLDLRQGRLAKLVGGSLRGQVTIRGTPSAPGAEDDVEIVTRDVELDELEVRTGEAVQFRYGRSHGSGRGLLARLTPRAAPRGSDSIGQGPNIGGVDSIRLDRDVRIRLEGMSGGFMPGKPAKEVDTKASDQAAPVLVSCRGSLTFNVAANVITLTDHVDVVRATPEGGSDQITCDLLAILLAAEAAKDSTADAKGPLKPTEIQAKGSPVVVRSTGAELEARATRLGYEVATRRILLDGTEPVSLIAKGSEMEARKIDYCPGPPGDPGSLMAVGPGWLRVMSPGQPPSHARWQQWLRLRPDGEGHVVSISGDADIVVETRGRLSAGEMHLWLDVMPRPPGAPPRDPAAGPDLSGVKPSRMLARGMVEVGADQVAARTDRLELWFRDPPAPPPAAAPAAAPPAQVAAVTTAPAAAPAAPPPAPPPQPAQPPGGRITATAALVRGLVTLTPKGAELTEMSMEGQVELVEQPTGASTEGPPVQIRGDQMQLSRPTAFDARAVVSGRPATIVGRGLDLEGPLVEFDRGRNRVTVDGAGKLSLPMPAGGPGLDGLALTGGTAKPVQPPPPGAAPGKLDVTWKGRLDFDGQTARFVEDVVANGGTTVVRSGSLDVVFDEPFEFAGDRGAKPGRQRGRQPEVSRIACGSGVKIESESIDEAGDRSVERLFVRDLVVERGSGEVSGTGPGRLTSTRKGQSPAFAAPSAPGSPPVRPVAAASKPLGKGLNYLGVDFQRGLRGNIHRRSMEFHQRVEAIWGPVRGWDDVLDPHAASGLPEGAVGISCDVLGVGQVPPMPGQPRGTLELNAVGNVLVEGESFTARSARLTWSEAKDLLVFAGDGRSDAQLFRQLKPGGQPSTAAAGRILYWRGLNRVEVEDARYLDLDQIGGGRAPSLPVPGAATPGTQPAPFAPQPVPGT
jgi:lipopolysaccharide export system protein LptA